MTNSRARSVDRFVERQEKSVVLVPCRYRGEDPVCCELSYEQARKMRNASMGKFENHGKSFRLFEARHREVPRAPVPSTSPDSSAAISPSEMHANVGITQGSPGEPAAKHIVDRAQNKVRAIGRRDLGTYDTRAPLAFTARSMGA